jgi:hypothetical protein
MHLYIISKPFARFIIFRPAASVQRFIIVDALDDVAPHSWVRSLEPAASRWRCAVLDRIAMPRIAAIIGAFCFAVLPFVVAAQTVENDLRISASPSLDPNALPLGDGRYSDAPRVGYLYPCLPKIFYSISQTGARGGGFWIHGSTWDLTQKPYVQGGVRWPNASFTVSRTGGARIFEGNDLPLGTGTGVFPVQQTDPAFQWDPNPNPIKPQSISFSTPLNPTPADTPSCVALPVAIGLDGVVFFSALDSHGRDEPAYEMQDQCGGMSGPNNMYHRYTPSNCIPHIHKNNALVGYALDGFGLFSPYDENGKELTTKDLDVCHGTTSPIMWEGKKVTMYHYVLTRDFPYSIACFRGKPASIPLPPPPPPPEWRISSWGNGLVGAFLNWLAGSSATRRAALEPIGKSALFKFNRGEKGIFIKCADQDSTQACVDAIAPFLERMTAPQ